MRILTTAGRSQDRCARPKPITIKALEISVSNGEESGFQQWDGAHIATARTAAARAYHSGADHDSRRQIDMAEVHDCFSITETVLMEDLWFQRPRARAPFDVLDVVF